MVGLLNDMKVVLVGQFVLQHEGVDTESIGSCAAAVKAQPNAKVSTNNLIVFLIMIL